VQDNADVEPGELWAYRARQVDELVEVRVLRLGTQRPARVLVRFVDDAFEGREEWVPPARLKVPWQDVVPFREREQAWGRVREAGIPDDDPRVQAAEQVLEVLSTMRTPPFGTGKLVRFALLIPLLWPPGWDWTPARSRITRWPSPTAMP
jgi:hypothetical protein